MSLLQLFHNKSLVQSIFIWGFNLEQIQELLNRANGVGQMGWIKMRLHMLACSVTTTMQNNTERLVNAGLMLTS